MFSFSDDRPVTQRRSILLPLIALLIAAIAVPAPVFAQGEPTQIVVRAVSHDAKLLQDPVGGAEIRITDAETGAVLAEGIQKGDSGSTAKIMREPRTRGVSIYDTEGAAQFDTTLTLDRPRRVQITARGPLDYPHAMQSASVTTTLMPGRDVTGDGIVLPIHGYIVETLRPATAPAAGETAEIRARVRMMCGCPTEPGGLWDSDEITIQAEALGRDGTVIAEQALTFTGTTSEFAGELSIPADAATLRVTAVDKSGTNAGLQTMDLAAE
jgi:hypothetical protein